MNGGSNLTYGIRTLYARHFERFDKWLTGDMSILEKPMPDEPKPAAVALGIDADVEEAAAILELLGGNPPRPEPKPEPKPDPVKKRKAPERKSLSSKVCCSDLAYEHVAVSKWCICTHPRKFSAEAQIQQKQEATGC